MKGIEVFGIILIVVGLIVPLNWGWLPLVTGIFILLASGESSSSGVEKPFKTWCPHCRKYVAGTSSQSLPWKIPCPECGRKGMVTLSPEDRGIEGGEARVSELINYAVFEDLDGGEPPKIHKTSCGFYQRWLRNKTKTTTWYETYTIQEARAISKRIDPDKEPIEASCCASKSPREE